MRKELLVELLLRIEIKVHLLKDLAEIFPPDVKCGEASPVRTRRKFLNDPSVSYGDLNCPFPSRIIETSCPEPCSCSLNTHYRETFMDCSDR